MLFFSFQKGIVVLTPGPTESTLPFYVIVPFLRSEATDVNIAARLVSDSLLTRTRQQYYKNIHEANRSVGQERGWWKLHNIPTIVLRRVSHLLGLGPVPATTEDHAADDDDTEIVWFGLVKTPTHTADFHNHPSFISACHHFVYSFVRSSIHSMYTWPYPDSFSLFV